MSDEVEIKIPSVGESITEVFIGEWYVPEGGWVKADDSVVGLETEKATVDVPAPVSGVVSRILKHAGESAEVGEVIGYMTPAEEPAGHSTKSEPPAERTQQRESPEAGHAESSSSDIGRNSAPVMPAAERLLEEHGVNAQEIRGTGPGGRVLKEDVERQLKAARSAGRGSRETRSVPLTPIRQTIAQRLVSAQHNAALLTTFNEIDVSRVKSLRAQFGESFQKKYGVKLGYMSFFVHAVVDALQEYPAINAKLDDKILTYHNYCDIGIAVGGGKGLVVPVLRNAENMSFAEIEAAISDFAVRARNNQISLEELEGGTFTITNGGVYGSLLSTPIVNPPQSGVLGMHGIIDRPVAANGEVVIRPMMYVALTYDHRVVDGREAVSFLRRVKEIIEDPTRLILEI